MFLTSLKMWRPNFFLYICCQLMIVFATPPCDIGELVFSVIIYRHGDRVPISSYPLDPYFNESLWPVPWGELTNVGKRGQYELGKWLRKRYENFLPQNYSKKDIYVRSTDTDRTLMSAYCNLAGLYQPDKNTNWNPDILWSPIPVHTIPENLDNVLAEKKPCPKYFEEQKKLLESPEFRAIDEKNSELYRYLSEHTGEKVASTREVSDLYSTLFIEELYHFELPNWTKSVYPEPMRSLSGFSFGVPCYTITLKRLKIGPLFKEILMLMEDKISGKLSQKIWMYSAHDSTIANVLQGLGVFEPHCPPYLSTILLELRRKDEKDFFVSVYYRNSSLVPAHSMRIPGCEKACSFLTFREILSELVPENWDEECQEIWLVNWDNLNTTTSIIIMTTLSIVSLFFLSLVIIFKHYRNRRWNQTEFAYTMLKMDAT